MLLLGIHTWRSAPPAETTRRPVHERNLLTAFVTTGLLTLANPMTLLGMTGILAAAGVAHDAVHTHGDTSAVITGVFCGSAAWWLILCACAGWLGRKLGPQTLLSLNHLAALFIIGFGLWQFAGLLYRKI